MASVWPIWSRATRLNTGDATNLAGWSDFRSLMWLTWNTIPTIPHSQTNATCWCAMKGLSPLNALFPPHQILLFSLFTLCCISFIPSSQSALSLLCCCCCVCVRPSMGAALAPQQSVRTHTRSLDARCVQLTPRSKHFHAHTHTHYPLLTDLTPASTQTARAPLRRVSVWQICAVSSRSPRRAALREAQEAQREDDKLSIRPGSGEFSSCLHTLCETSRPHVGSRGALIWLRPCHGCTWAELLFFCISSLFPLCCCSSENCNSAGKRGNVFLEEAARLDVIAVKGMMNWFIGRHRKLHFKWMKHKEGLEAGTWTSQERRRSENNEEHWGKSSLSSQSFVVRNSAVSFDVSADKKRALSLAKLYLHLIRKMWTIKALFIHLNERQRQRER